ncbi:MoaD/ThiS family protein [Candidatus Micrarchaeota archaeon]|nr:MoaD/ThiS family protein [Candidatus Micrarchaeota archaeon]
MEIRVVSNRRTRAVQVNKGASARAMLSRLGLNGETVIIKLNGKVAHPDEILSAGDLIEFVGIIYGG